EARASAAAVGPCQRQRLFQRAQGDGGHSPRRGPPGERGPGERRTGRAGDGFGRHGHPAAVAPGAAPPREEAMTASTVHPVDFEPSLIAPHTYTSRRLRVRLDVATVIALLVCLLYMLPAALIVPGLTFAGRPALVLALALFAWWLLARLSPSLFMVGPQPLRWACLIYLVSILLSYIAGLLRGLPTLEANRQNFTLLATFQFIGLVLMSADGVANWDRLRKILRVFLWAAAFMAVIGLIQSVFEFDIAQRLIVPGLEIKADMPAFQKRGGGLFRVAGTAIHYIEFSTVLAMAVPFGLHFARFAPHK